MSPSQGNFSITCPLTRMMVKAKWLGLSSYMTLFPCYMRKMDVLTNIPTYYLHTHFTNLHFDGCEAYRLTSCAHLRTYVISLKTLSIIFIQTILTKNYYNNGRLHMNRLWIFGSASTTCSFKLQRARWIFSIFGISSSIVLRNLLVPRRSLKSSLA